MKKRDSEITAAWRQYESGKDYNRKIGLYENVQQNERFYRGDQWKGLNVKGMPLPIMNIIKRVINYLISSISAQSVSVVYSADSMPILPDSAYKDEIRTACETLTRSAAYRWKKDKIDALIHDALLDAAISGDGVLFTYWDDTIQTGQPYQGDFVTVCVDSVNFFVSDVNQSDIQTQEYILLAGRQSVTSLKKEAEAEKVKKEDIEKITADTERDTQAGDYAEYENEDTEAEKATYLIKFWRGDDGNVIWEKSTKSVVIKRRETHMRLYPVCSFAWDRVKNSYHGCAPITGLIDNQKYVNKAFALVMKHMTDTAFSKILYDKTLIPSWSNEVGQAIGVTSGGDVTRAAMAIGTGTMQSGFLDIINLTMQNTKELMGANDAALGEVKPDNTSAIIALQEASSIPLEMIRRNLYQCLEDMANIWLEMMFEYYPDDRFLLFENDAQNQTEVLSARVPFSQMREALLCATVNVGASARFNNISAINTLDKLLTGQYISFRQYLERMPDGILNDRDKLLDEIRAQEQMQMQAQQMQQWQQFQQQTARTPPNIP